MKQSNKIVVIPAYEPDDKLIGLLKEITEKTNFHVIIVNDGSSQNTKPVFDKALCYGNVLVHPVNKGKGEAIKTALHYIYNEIKTHEEKNTKASVKIIAIADADGQHKTKDIIRVMKEAEEDLETLILGSREFKGKVPFRSKAGNRITSLVFRASSGVWLQDTQTGLRAFSEKLIPVFLGIEGSRYEYEINVLLQCTKSGLKIKEVPIETVYIGQNESSHFHVIRDSYRIYKEILKFSFSSFISFIIDFILYSVLTVLTGNIILSNVGARLVSATGNFLMNRKYVFKSKERAETEALKYFALASVILLLNTYLLNAVVSCIHNDFAGKILVEVFLFIISWMVQKSIVFRTRRKKGEINNV